jgi:hypothetical protein
VLLALAVGGAALYAAVTGALSLRTRGVYFIMVTLAFAQLAYFVVHDTKAAGGSDGIFLYVKPVLEVGGVTLIDLDSRRHLYYTVLAALAGTYAFIALLLRSRFGHALAGIRVNEQRMRAAGFSTTPYKLAAFVIAGALAGLAGFLLAVKDGAVNPELLSWHESGAVLLMLILGGIGSLRGAVIGPSPSRCCARSSSRKASSARSPPTGSSPSASPSSPSWPPCRAASSVSASGCAERGVAEALLQATGLGSASAASPRSTTCPSSCRSARSTP